MDEQEFLFVTTYMDSPTHEYWLYPLFSERRDEYSDFWFYTNDDCNLTPFFFSMTLY